MRITERVLRLVMCTLFLVSSVLAAKEVVLFSEVRSANEIGILTPSEVKEVARIRAGWKNLPEPKLFTFNRVALSGKELTIARSNGERTTYIGSPVANGRSYGVAWTGTSHKDGALMLDESEQEFVGDIREEDGRHYTIRVLHGARFALIREIGRNEFTEPPEMSGHPPFPKPLR